MSEITDHLKSILKNLHNERRMIQEQLNNSIYPIEISMYQRNYYRVLDSIMDLDNKICEQER
jgi:hypothetical protein